MLIKQLMNVLMIEIRAERGFDFNVDADARPRGVRRPPRRRPSRRPSSSTRSARTRPRTWPTCSCSSPSCGRSTSRPRTGVGRGQDLHRSGVGEDRRLERRQRAAHQRQATRELIERCLKPRPDGAALLAKFDALADEKLKAMFEAA